MLANLKKAIDKKQMKRLMITLALTMIFFILQKETMLASQIDTSEIDAFMEPVETFLYILTTLVSSVGTALVLWAILEWGMAWNDSQGTMNGMAFRRLFGGFVVLAAPQLVSLFT